MATHIRYLLAGGILAVGLFSCSKTALPPKPQPSPFAATIDPAATSIPAAGGIVNITIKAGSDGWWITAPSTNWCTIPKTFGSGDYVLPLTLKANSTGAVRSISIVVNPSFGLKADTVMLNQLN